MGAANPSEEQPQVVVHLRHGAHRRTRVPGRALLINRDGRREAVYLVDVRLFHLAEELPGIRGETLHVPALALSVNRVKRQTRLTGSRKAGEDDELVAWEVYGDVLKVMLARAMHADLIEGHLRRVSRDRGVRNSMHTPVLRQPAAMPDCVRSRRMARPDMVKRSTRTALPARHRTTPGQARSAGRPPRHPPSVPTRRTCPSR